MNNPAEYQSVGFTPCVEKVPDIAGEGIERYECDHCGGIAIIILVHNTEKVTYPTIEFCPLCGNSVAYPWPKEAEE
jgi:ribosomal protein S27AE